MSCGTKKNPVIVCLRAKTFLREGDGKEFSREGAFAAIILVPLAHRRPRGLEASFIPARG